MHLQKVLLESFTSNCFNAVLLPCVGPFKLIVVGTGINITPSFIAALICCNSGSNQFTNVELKVLVLLVGSDHCLPKVKNFITLLGH